MSAQSGTEDQEKFDHSDHPLNRARPDDLKSPSGGKPATRNVSGGPRAAGTQPAGKQPIGGQPDEGEAAHANASPRMADR